MLCNNKMKSILHTLPDNEISACNDYPIWMKLTDDGRPYWGVGSFCGLDGSLVSYYDSLTDFEWNGNEINLDFSSDIGILVRHGLAIATGWKEQLSTEYPHTPFDILLYVDEVMDNVSPSVSLRLWAVRGGYHYIDYQLQNSDLYGIHNPALIIPVNY